MEDKRTELDELGEFGLIDRISEQFTNICLSSNIISWKKYGKSYSEYKVIFLLSIFII